jgi:hypothetical protein
MAAASLCSGCFLVPNLQPIKRPPKEQWDANEEPMEVFCKRKNKQTCEDHAPKS